MPLGFSCNDDYPFDDVFKKAEEIGSILTTLFDNALSPDVNEVIIQIGLTRELTIKMSDLVEQLSNISTTSLICKILKETGIEAELDKLQSMLSLMYIEISNLEGNMKDVPKIGLVLDSTGKQADETLSEYVNEGIRKTDNTINELKGALLNIVDDSLNESSTILESKVLPYKREIDNAILSIKGGADFINAQVEELNKVKSTIEDFVKRALDEAENIASNAITEVKQKLKEVLQVLVVLGISPVEIDSAIDNVEFKGQLKQYIMELFNAFLDSASARLNEEF